MSPDMTSTAYDALLDEAIDMLYAGTDRDYIVSYLVETFGWDEDTIEIVVTDAQKNYVA